MPGDSPGTVGQEQQPPALSVVIPVHDEAASLARLFEELRTVLDTLDQPAEVIFVDDASTDDSVAIVRALADRDRRVRLVQMRRPAGLTAALHAGLQAARGDVIVTLDADLQNDPRDIPRLLAELGRADAVIGWRRTRHDPWFRRMSSRIANAVRNALTGERIHDSACGLRALRRRCAGDLPPFDGMHRFVPTLLALAGHRVVEVTVRHRPRRFGRSHFGLWNRLLVVSQDLLVLRWMLSRRLTYDAEEKSETGESRVFRTGPALAPAARGPISALRLAALWLAAAATLAIWGLLAAPPRGADHGPGSTEVSLGRRPPAGDVLSLWIYWDAPVGRTGWVVLEGARPWDPSTEMSWRRQIHPGWNYLVWSELPGKSGEAPLRLRLQGGIDTRWHISPPRIDRRFGLYHLNPIRGLLVALGLGVLLGIFALPRCWPTGPVARRWWIAVAGIAGLALWLRLHTIAVPSLWFDEVLTAIGAQSLDWILHTPQAFGHPPLYYLLAWIVGGGAGDEWALRAPSLAAGVGTVVALAWLGRRLLGPASGLVAALALSVSPFHVELSQLARPYALFLLLTVLSLTALVEAVERNHARAWVALSILLAMNLYTHYFAVQVLVLEALAAGILLVAHRRRRGHLVALLSFTGAVILFLPWFPVIARLGTTQFWQGDLPARLLGELVAGVLAPQFLGPGAATGVGAVLLAGALWSLRRRLELLAVVSVWVALPPALLWLAQPAHFVAGRHLAFVLPVVMLLLGHGIATATAVVAGAAARFGPIPAWIPRLVAALVAGALIVAWGGPTAAGLRGYYQGRHGTDWRTVAHVLDRLIRDDEPVFATTGALYPLRHYWRLRVTELAAAGFPEAPSAGRGRRWVVAHKGWDRPPALHDWLERYAIQVGEIPPSWSLPGITVHRLRGGTHR